MPNNQKINDFDKKSRKCQLPRDLFFQFLALKAWYLTNQPKLLSFNWLKRWIPRNTGQPSTCHGEPTLGNNQADFAHMPNNSPA